MLVVVEYLLIVQKSGTFCDSTDVFDKLLRVDSGIMIQGGKIRHRDEFECDYWNVSGDIAGKDQRFFHLKFAIDDDSPAALERFTEFLKVVRSIMSRMGSQPETLWDDISFCYSKQGYDLVYRIENLMRKLIANFMLVTIGKEWVTEASPAEIKQAIAKGKRREDENDYLNALHNIDFIHLSDFLLKPYSSKQNTDILTALRKAQTIEEFKAVQQIAPQSNWSRYFSGLVDCEDGYLKKRWDELYELRCKVAHNAIVSKHDLDRIATLVGELQSKLEDAIKKLPQVKVPASEIEQVAENAAGTVNSMLGDFIIVWRDLESVLFSKCEELGQPQRRGIVRDAATALVSGGILNRLHLERLVRLQQIKNHVIHPTGVAVSGQELQAAIEEIRSLVSQIVNPPDQPLSCRPEPPQ